MQQVHDSGGRVAEAIRRTVAASAKSHVSRIYLCGDRGSGGSVLSAEADSKAAKILGNEKFEFVPLAEEEIQFLYQISKTAEKNGTEQRLLVHPSRITVDKAGTINVISGPLKEFEKEILRVNLHKRYAVVKVKMLGEKTVLFGIVMEKDGERNS